VVFGETLCLPARSPAAKACAAGRRSRQREAPLRRASVGRRRQAPPSGRGVERVAYERGTRFRPGNQKDCGRPLDHVPAFFWTSGGQPPLAILRVIHAAPCQGAALCAAKFRSKRSQNRYALCKPSPSIAILRILLPTLTPMIRWLGEAPHSDPFRPMPPPSLCQSRDHVAFNLQVLLETQGDRFPLSYIPPPYNASPFLKRRPSHASIPSLPSLRISAQSCTQ